VTTEQAMQVLLIVTVMTGFSLLFVSMIKVKHCTDCKYIKAIKRRFK